MSELNDILDATQCPECKRLRAEIERLRRVITVNDIQMSGNGALHREAADEIERLRSALKDVLDVITGTKDNE